MICSQKKTCLVATETGTGAAQFVAVAAIGFKNATATATLMSQNILSMLQFQLVQGAALRKPLTETGTSSAGPVHVAVVVAAAAGNLALNRQQIFEKNHFS